MRKAEEIELFDRYGNKRKFILAVVEGYKSERAANKAIRKYFMDIPKITKGWDPKKKLWYIVQSC